MMIIFMVVNTLFLVQFIYVIIIIVNDVHPYKGSVGLP